MISADLVFIGLRMSFDTSGKTFETWALMIGLAGYTLLLAATACLLIRSCRVWDDVRTLLLLVVLMFLATSVTFDDTLASNPRLGRACFAGGFVFAAAVSEAVLRVIRLSLPALFRVPYYLILALFFLYPMAVSPFVGDPDGPALQWALWGFSPTAGLVFLSLLPAVRRGPESVAKNGSPWRWPLYPWVLFAVLGLGVCAGELPLHLAPLRGGDREHLRALFPGAVPAGARPPDPGARDRRGEPGQAPGGAGDAGRAAGPVAGVAPARRRL